jgi:hypothetical protein
MTSISFAAPILPGKLEAWRRFQQESLGSRLSEHQASRQRLGITKELAWLQQTPQGDMTIVYFETSRPEQVFQALASSDAPYDVWFRQQVLNIHGLDLTRPQEGPPPELTFQWTA